MTDVAITIRSATVRRGTRTVLSEINADILMGELVGLIGPNGAGKTTLLRAAMGLQPLEDGSVRILDRDLSAWDRRDLGRSLAYMPQSGAEAWPIRVDRFVALGRHPHLEPWRRPGPEDSTALRHAMQAADIEAFADRPVTALSGGERARVHFARALAVGAPILFADEPIAGLDPYHQLHVLEMLRDQAVDQGRAVVVVLHDLALAHRFCHRLILMQGGRIRAEGTPTAVLSRDHLAETYGVVPADPDELTEIVLPWHRRAGPR